MILLDDTQVITGFRLVIIAGIVLVVLIIALAVFNGTRDPKQYKKDWEKKRRERKPSTDHEEAVKD